MPVFIKGNHKVLFVHVPKTGGTSLEQVFQRAGYQMYLKDGTAGPHTINTLRRNTPQHLHAAPLREMFNLSRFEAIFMMVREPIARFRSEYAMRVADESKADAASVDRWADDVLRRYTENTHLLDNHLRPQSDYYLPGAHVYRLEDGISSVLHDLNERYDLGVETEAPRAMEAKGVASRDVQVSPELARRLNVFYRSDFDLFGYTPQQP